MKKLLTLPFTLKNLYMRKKIKKRDFEFEAYPAGTPVYALSFWHNYGDPTDHVAIYQTVVVDVNFSLAEGLEYVLGSKNTGEPWELPIPERHVSEDIDDLIEIAKKVWKHED